MLIDRRLMLSKRALKRAEFATFLEMTDSLIEEIID